MHRLVNIIITLTLTAIAAAGQSIDETVATNTAYLRQPYSMIAPERLETLAAEADSLRETAQYADYVSLVDKAVSDMAIYQECVAMLNSPFDFDRIVDLRKRLIPLITDEGYFTQEQQPEMDRLDIYLSRYRGSVALFQQIIRRINADPVVTQYRATAKNGRPSGAERKKYIQAISDIVYRPGTRDLTQEIKDYISLIPYLNAMLPAYLNAIASEPTYTCAQESEIMSIELPETE